VAFDYLRGAYLAPADWETTSPTQLFRPEVPILPLMKYEMRKMTILPLGFQFFLPSLLPSSFSIFSVILLLSSFFLHFYKNPISPKWNFQKANFIKLCNEA
jgi:hypothetical protein